MFKPESVDFLSFLVTLSVPASLKTDTELHYPQCYLPFGMSGYRSEKGDIVVTMPTGATADLELMGRAEVLPSTFQGDIYPTKAVGKIVGTALNSRAQEGTHPNRGGGKIALAGAREQCLQNFVPDETRSAGCPHLMISAEEGRIRLESLGWIDNIIRGYTMTHGTTDEEAMDTT